VHALYLTSEVADAVDYYFLYGPEFDKIVACYRELTGAARFSESGRTAIGSARTATTRSKRCSTSRRNIATCTYARQHRAGLVLVNTMGEQSSTKIIPTQKP